MENRSPSAILAEWRAAERELEAATDEVTIEALRARVAALREEQRAATDARLADAHGPGREVEAAGA